MAKSLFLVEDDEAFVYVCRRVCRKIDGVAWFETAENGQAALECLRRWLTDGTRLPDVMFVDINMPLLDGFGFLAEFKKLRDAFPALESIEPIMMLTSSEQEGDRQKAFATGVVDDYFVKPGSIRELEAVFLGCLS